MLELPPHHLRVALLQPEIAPNTGNVGRLCVATGAELHLVRPLGFVLDDKNLKRSGLDYWPRLRLTVHDDDSAFFSMLGESRVWLFSSKGERSIWDADFEFADVLIFGNETGGIKENIRQKYKGRQLRIPQVEGERCLNLSTAVGVGLYEALRRIKATSSTRPQSPAHTS